jgi:NAD(P)-dependent dehydrogenase (short-subunit alcohol dehydrogenase family)
MRILVVGGTGTIGAAVVEALRPEHEVLVAGHSRGEHRVDITSMTSIRRLFDAVGTVDAVVSCAGRVAFGPLDRLTDEQFRLCIDDKLMGQVNLVRAGITHLRDGGSFTLTSGLLSRYPVPGGSAITLVNAGLEAFARAAVLDLPRGIRINVVSPPWVGETLAAMGRDPSDGLPAAIVARSYLDAVHGTRTGETLDARDHA